MNAKTVTPPESKCSFVIKCAIVRDIVRLMLSCGMLSDWALLGELSSVKLVIGWVAVRYVSYRARYRAIVSYRTIQSIQRYSSKDDNDSDNVGNGNVDSIGDGNVDNVDVDNVSISDVDISEVLVLVHDVDVVLLIALW